MKDWKVFSRDAQDYIVACAIATEVPPRPMGSFTADMIVPAIEAVIDVIRNRMMSEDFPDTPLPIVFQKKAFSAVYLQEGYWIRSMAGTWFPNHVERCFDLWQVRHRREDSVDGATHYYSPVSMIPPGRVPSWATKLEEVIVDGIDPQYFRFFK